MKIDDVKVQGNIHLPTYLFSNSPLTCLLTNVVLPTPPSPTLQQDEGKFKLESFEYIHTHTHLQGAA